MHNPTFLTLSRNRVFHFRWSIPRELHPQRKRSAIKVSLRTREPQQALHLARCLGYVAQTVVTNGAACGMQYHQMRSTLHRHFSDLLASQRRKMQETGPLGPLDRAALETGLAVSTDAAAGRNSLNLVDDDTDLLAQFVAKYKMPLNAGTREHDMFQAEFYKAYRDFCQSALDHSRSLSRYDYNAVVAEKPEPSASPAPVSVSEVIQKFADEEIRVGRWVKRSEDQIRQYLHVLASLLGPDTDIRQVSGEQARQVKDALLRLPKNMNKNPATRGKSLDEVLAVDHADKLTIHTVNSYLQAYKRLFEWATDAKLTDDNPFAKSLIRENKRKSEKRQEFTPDQLKSIEATLLGNHPDVKPKEAHKWGSLIAMYTGARLNEVCQLTVQDVRQHEGIWCFDFNDAGEGKHVKNESSIRIVPIHSRLVELGFLVYFEKLKSGRFARLFPDYSYSPKHGWGKNLSVWFNNALLVKLGIKSKQHVFHSLRHSMATQLFHADVPEPIIKGIVGHTQKGVTQQHYFSRGYKVQQLKEAIEKF